MFNKMLDDEKHLTQMESTVAKCRIGYLRNVRHFLGISTFFQSFDKLEMETKNMNLATKLDQLCGQLLQIANETKLLIGQLRQIGSKYRN